MIQLLLLDRVEDDLHREVQREPDPDGRQRGPHGAAVVHAGEHRRDGDRGATGEDQQQDRADLRPLPPAGQLQVGEHRERRRGGDPEDLPATCRRPPTASDQNSPATTRDAGDHRPGDHRVLEEVVEADRGPLLEQDGDPEGRQRVEQERQEDDPVVETAVLPQRADDADGDADDQRQDRRGGDQLQRRADGVRQQVLDGLHRAPRDAEVAGEQVAEPLEEPDDDVGVQVAAARCARR